MYNYRINLTHDFLVRGGDFQVETKRDFDFSLSFLP